MRLSVFTILLIITVSASASEPGDPIDCSDWVFDLPGLSCSEFISDCGRAEDELGNTTSIHDPICFNSKGTATDLEGYVYHFCWIALSPDTCNGGNNPPLTPHPASRE